MIQVLEYLNIIHNQLLLKLVKPVLLQNLDSSYRMSPNILAFAYLAIGAAPHRLAETVVVLELFILHLYLGYHFLWHNRLRRILVHDFRVKVLNEVLVWYELSWDLSL